MWNEQIIMMLLEGIKDTLYMTLTSTLIGYVIGLPMGILLTVTDKDGIHPNAAVYKVLDVIANLIRSVPFLILLIVLIPFTRFLIGRSYGPTATIVPLVIAAAPYIFEPGPLKALIKVAEALGPIAETRASELPTKALFNPALDN